MTSQEIYRFLDQLYDFKNQEAWDNSTSYINNNHDVENIIVCLDITENVYKIAVENNVDLIISHHPFLIQNPTIQNFHTRKLLGQFVNANISIITLHTPFDKSLYGMNVALANKLNLMDLHFANDHCTIIGVCPEIMNLDELAVFAKEQLKSNSCSYLERYHDLMVKKVAICGGAGFSSIYDLNPKEFDVFITCDLKHHNWVDSIELNIPIINLNHNIENIFVDVISTKLNSIIPEANILKIKSAIKMHFLND